MSEDPAFSRRAAMPWGEFDPWHDDSSSDNDGDDKGVLGKEGLEQLFAEPDIPHPGDGYMAVEHRDEEAAGSPARGGGGRFGSFKRSIAARVSKVVDRVGHGTASLGEVLGRSALSASELLTDSELRSKGAEVVITGASSTLSDLGRSLAAKAGSIRQGLSKRIQEGASTAPRQVQAVMRRVQHRIHQQRLRAMLRAAKDDLVDVQVGLELYEEAPQELRSRLWMALVNHPGLGMGAFTKRSPAAASRRPQGRQRQQEDGGAASELVVDLLHDVSVVITTEPEGGSQAQGAELNVGRSGAEVAEDNEDLMYRELCRPATGRKVQSQKQHAAFGAAEAAQEERRESDPVKPVSSVGLTGFGDAWMDGAWDMVEPWDPPAPQQSRNTMASILENYESLASSKAGAATDHDESWQKLGGLIRAMWELEYPIPSQVPPDSRYAILLQISIGQEDVDEVITRDIHRTFPEHPQFGLEDVGQAALFNVLKAYSLHDLEVGYCQGMAFVAGILLMYLPEEPAFQAFCLLMDSNGPDLRSFYLPGLEGLKEQLAVFEYLLDKFHSGIAGHLKKYGIPPMLYASQWFLTGFACPFPSTFAARVLDVMLAQHCKIIFMRTALAVMAECELDILGLDDFEEIITDLKFERQFCSLQVKPCNWSVEQAREVLNVAVHSYLTEEDVEEAIAAVRAELAASAPADEPKRAATGCSEQPPPEAGSAPVRMSSAVETMVRQASLGQIHSASAVEAGGTGQDIAAQLDAQQAEMRADYMAMVLALDMMFDQDSNASIPKAVDAAQPESHS